MIPLQQTTARQPVDGKALRHACGNFATGVTVITSGSAGNAAGTTVNSFTSVSLDPPLVLFCLHEDSRLLPVVRESGGFVVNFLTAGQEPLAWAFANGRSARVEEAAHRDTVDGLPVLRDALAHLECRLMTEYDGGDHAILLGSVVGFAVSGHEVEPLVFYRGAMRFLREQAASGARP